MSGFGRDVLRHLRGLVGPSAEQMRRVTVDFGAHVLHLFGRIYWRANTSALTRELPRVAQLGRARAQLLWFQLEETTGVLHIRFNTSERVSRA